MKETSLAGKRYINLVRCSSSKQADTSLVDQLALLNDYAARHGMTHVDDVLVDGVSGSIPGARHDFDKLIQRKETREDFDVVLLQDTSRLTRAGNEHGAKVEYDFQAAGIEVVYVAEDVPEGEFAGVFKSLRFAQAKSQAVSISFTSTRGLMSALLDGRCAYCKRPPYAVDKLYVSADGKPQHILRLLADRTQLQLDPETGAVVGRFERDARTGKSAHYIKQKQERILLIPGAPDRVEVLRRIYSRHYRDGIGARRIARELNDNGVSGPEGGAWNVEQVRQLLLNPIYRGVSYGNYSSSAIYHMRAPNAPQRVEVPLSELARRRRPPRRVRPSTDWVVQEHPALRGLLDPDVRALAERRQEEYLKLKAEGHTPTPNRDRHNESRYLLKGILTTRQGGLPMSGRLSGTGRSRTRYYRASRANSTPRTDPILNRSVPAEPLEQTLLALLQRVLTCGNDVERDVRAAIDRARQRTRSATDDPARLRARRDATKRKLALAIDTLDAVGQDAARETLNRLQSEIRSLDDQIRQAERAAPPPLDVDKEVARVTSILTNLGARLHELPPVALRRLLAVFVSKAEVDLETRNVKIELRLPEFAWGAMEGMGLDPMLPCKTGIEAHDEAGAIILRPKLLWFPGLRCFGATDFGAAA